MTHIQPYDWEIVFEERWKKASPKEIQLSGERLKGTASTI